MLEWLSVALGMWWLAGGGIQDAPHVLWVEGAADEVSLSGEHDPLEAGERVAEQRIALGDQSILWLLDSTPSVVQIRGPGTFLAIGGLVRPANEVAARPFSRSVAFFDRPTGANRPGAIVDAGEGDDPKALGAGAPRDTALVEDGRRLRWSVPHPTAEVSLVVERREPDGGLILVERWRGIRGGTHSLHAPLLPGTWYRWTIARAAPGDPNAQQPDGPRTHSSWFRVLPPEAHAAVLRQLEEVKVLEQAADAQGLEGAGLARAAEVLRAEVLEAHGLFQAAEEAWASLADDNPQAAGIARRWQRMRRRTLRPPEPISHFRGLFDWELL